MLILQTVLCFYTVTRVKKSEGRNDEKNSSGLLKISVLAASIIHGPYDQVFFFFFFLGEVRVGV